MVVLRHQGRTAPHWRFRHCGTLVRQPPWKPAVPRVSRDRRKEALRQASARRLWQGPDLAARASGATVLKPVAEGDPMAAAGQRTDGRWQPDPTSRGKL